MLPHCCALGAARSAVLIRYCLCSTGFLKPLLGYTSSKSDFRKSEKFQSNNHKVLPRDSRGGEQQLCQPSFELGARRKELLRAWNHVVLQGVLDSAGDGGGAGLRCPERRASDIIGRVHRPRGIFKSTTLKMVSKFERVLRPGVPCSICRARRQSLGHAWCVGRARAFPCARSYVEP